MSKKYFIDFDNTLCHTVAGHYNQSVPIPERIQYVHQLKEEGHHITIWTARGSRSGVDYSELTKKQLEEWGVPYDVLLMGKPDYDIYIDDKSHNVDTFWPVPPINDSASTSSFIRTIPLPMGDSIVLKKSEMEHSKKQAVEIVPKGWGKEIIFVNNEDYCGKLLCFEKGKKFSMHYHLLKRETWYVSKGRFILIWIETDKGITYSEYLNVGDVITNERGEPHQLIALEDSEVFEVSTRHYDCDSYRVRKGD